MLAFHNDPALKADVLDRLDAHRRADLSLVMPRWLLWLLTDELPQYAGDRADVAAVTAATS